MFPTPAETKLAVLLHKAILAEKLLETSRQRLSELDDFNPASVFRALDTHSKGYLTHNDLFAFLRYSRRCLIHTRRSVKPITAVIAADLAQTIAIHTRDGLLRLGLRDLKKFLTPVDSLVLALFSPPPKSTKFAPLTQECKNALADLIEAEAEKISRLQLWREGFGIDCFAKLDPETKGYITEGDLHVFLLGNKADCSVRDVAVFVKRFGEGKLQYGDLVRALFPAQLPSQSPAAKSAATVSPTVPKTPEKSRAVEDALVTPSTQTTQERLSPAAATQPKTATLRSSIVIPPAKKEPSNRSIPPIPTARKPHPPMWAGLVSILQAQLEQNRRLETSRCNLALQSDFTLLNGYGVFNCDFEGELTPSKLFAGMRRLGSKITECDAYLWISRCSPRGTVGYREFCDLLTPRGKELAGLLRARKVRYAYPDPALVFGKRTADLLRGMLEELIRVEDERRGMARDVSRSIYFSPEVEFRAFDCESKGRVTVAEVWNQCDMG